MWAEIGPRSAQDGGSPVIIGGMPSAAQQRVGRWGDGFFGPVADSATMTLPEAIVSTIQAYGNVGVDEVALWPTIAEPDHVDRLAQTVG